MVTTSEFLVYDRWLSGVLKLDVYRLAANDEFITEAGKPESAAYRRLKEVMESPVFIYARVPSENLSAVKFLEENGFNMIDTTVIFSKPVESDTRSQGDYDVGFAAADDEEGVVSLARRSFEYSRFHLDSNFTRETADETRAGWARSYFTEDRGNAIVVAREDRAPVGFLLLVYGEDGSLVIDLIAVDRGFRRRGIARDMIAFAQANCLGFTELRVGTQLVNLPSIRFYEDTGFRMLEAQYTFHYHHKESSKR